MKEYIYTSTPPTGRTACEEPQCLYKGALYLTSVPVQGCTLPYLSACKRVHFTLLLCLYKGALYLTSLPVQGCTLSFTFKMTNILNARGARITELSVTNY